MPMTIRDEPAVDARALLPIPAVEHMTERQLRGYVCVWGGEELANSNAFAQCQVEKVFKTVCFRAPGNNADRTQVATMTANFKSNGYRLKQVFAEAAVYCMGD